MSSHDGACPRCGRETDEFLVCGSCGHHSRMDARSRIELLTSAFNEQDGLLEGRDPLGFDGYPEAVVRARADTGLREAVVWGRASIDHVECALIVLDFAFLGGSMGAAAGEKVARAFDAATARCLPVACVTASGGARMQEGMVALVQMAKVAEARRLHAATGLGQVTLLTSPTTGGVYASFASLADVILAEPGAHVGFAGPRVIRDLTGQTPPPETHTAEWAHRQGLVDALVPRAQQRASLGRVLRAFTRRQGPRGEGSFRSLHGGPHRSPSERLLLARDPSRPKGPALVDALLDDQVALRGDRSGGGDDESVLVRMGSLRPTGQRITVIAQDCTGGRRLRPAGYRKAVRALELAGRLGLPVVTVVDTPGAEPLPDSEAGGVAQAIAATFVALLSAPVPTVAVVTGEGGSGGALAMTAADRVLMWENSVFSVISPEGAASILHRDASRSADLAERLRIEPRDMVELGVADAVVAEPPQGAQSEPEPALRALAGVVADHLHGLEALSPDERLSARSRRWREAGNRWLTDG
ncbi:MAG TPA: carboxyl transferase domain-containing protein [Actinomycetota bacterium]|nr:carboxyl transferase domain-containing protein [Actinomycetota bacterium]